MSFLYGDFPCHRVVNHQGRISPGWIEQKDLLKSEGVTFKDDFCVDLKNINGIYNQKQIISFKRSNNKKKHISM